MEKRKVAFLTLGCKVNQYETNGMIQSFQNNGYDICEFDSSADIYVINTCTVTNMSDRKSRQMLRQAKKNNKESIVVAVGCYVQVAKDEIEKIPEIDLVLGTNEKTNIVKYVEEYINEKEKLDKIDDVMQNKEYGDFGSVTYTEKTRAVIKVQDGCDRFCSYCIIPYARGRVRSRNPESVIKEIKEIALKGIKEVVITGIHVASYGIDFKEQNIRLIDLLEEINKIEGLKRIRLGSLEPNIITDEFVERLKKLDKICDHFHLSLQSGCNDTLKRMNRKYTTDDFEKVVTRLRNAFPNVALTTDIIVGFPGETEEEFDTTYKYLEKIKFYQMHVFKYSQRKGTRAAVMHNQIDGKIKEERSRKLLKLSNENEKDFINRYVDRETEVLFEQKDGEYIKGHTSNYIIVKVKGKNIENKVIKVKIISEENLELVGKIMK